MDPRQLEDLKQDFLASLRDDLTFNSRPVIMNLTQIAGENIAGASTVAKALEDHIQKAPPSLKLPAMYLLDSICKNVGSPYPQLFQRNIYRTFMDAYTLVEPPIRRKLEELMSTWKEPPSTGIYPNPVFPQDVTRKIENALLKAKTLALQLEQRRQREMAAAGLLPHRNTPPLPFPQPHQPDWSGNPNVVNPYLRITSGPPLGPPAPSNQDILLHEIRNLLSSVSQALLLNPGDEAAKTQGAALDQLQMILQTSVLPYNQIEAVRLQLASLPISQQRPPQTSTPPIVDNPPPAQDRNTESLLNSLRAAGLLGVPAASTSAPQIAIIQPLATNANAANLRNSDLELTSASLQKPRPYLIDILYNKSDLQCRTCGRRFPNTEDGRTKRDAHLDWHFRQNRKLRDNLARVQTRSWYLTEEEWIKYREEDTSIIPISKTAQVRESTPQPDATIPAPTGALADLPCPICKEKFNSEWDEDKEDWVWRNAVKVGGKIYHASCFAETRGKVVGSNSTSRSGTPQPSSSEPSLGSILGKRKGISNSQSQTSKVPRLTG